MLSRIRLQTVGDNAPRRGTAGVRRPWFRRIRWARIVHLAAAWSAMFAVALPPLPATLLAADYYFDADETATGNDGVSGANLGGSGDWDLDAPVWWSLDAADTVSWPGGVNRAVFWGATGTVTLRENVGVGGLVFAPTAATGYTLTDDSAEATLSLGSGGIVLEAGSPDTAVVTLDVGLALTASQSWTNDSAALLTVNNEISLGGNTLTLADTSTGGLTIAGVLSGTGGVIVNNTGSGLSTFTAANSYTGATTLQRGSLTISGLAGSIAYSSSITIEGGRLTLDNSAGNVPDDTILDNNNGIDEFGRIGNSTQINFGPRGELAIVPNASADSREIVGALRLTDGPSTITIASAASRVTTLEASSLTRSTGSLATALVRGTSLGQTQATLVSRILLADDGASLDLVGSKSFGDDGVTDTYKALKIVPWLMGDTSVGGNGSSFVTYDPTYGLRVLHTTNQMEALTAGSTTQAEPINARVTANAAIGAGVNLVINSLLFTSSSTVNAGAGSTLTINSGALAASSSGGILGSSFSSITLGDETRNEGYVTVASGTLSINAVLAVAGTGTLVKSGNGTLVLNGVNTFKDLVIHAGTLQARTSNQSVGTGTITLGNATLQLIARTIGNDLIVAAGGPGTARITNSSEAGNATINGSVTLHNHLSIDQISNRGIALNGSISGTGNITIAGSGSAATTLAGASINHVGYVINNHGSTGAATISGSLGTNVLGVIQNSATSAVTLSGNNTFTGGITINAGTVNVSSLTHLGGATGNITFGGNGTLALTSTTGSMTIQSTRTISLAAGATGSITMVNPTNNVIAAKITGAGNLSLRRTSASAAANQTLTLSNPANDFLGSLHIASDATNGMLTVSVAGLADSATADGNIRLGSLTAATGSGTFMLGNLATAPLVLNHRRIELVAATGGGALDSSGLTPAYRLAINTDLLVTGVGNKTLTLQGDNFGDNTFAGKIADGVGSVISIVKSGTGSWKLGGENTYTGTTAVNTGFLTFENTAAVAPSSLVTVADGAGLGLRIGGTGYFSLADVDALFFNGTQTGVLSNVTLAAAALVGIDTTLGDVVYDTSLAGTRGLFKEGANTLTLTGSNTLTGGLILNSGTVSASGGGTFGPTNGAVTINGGAKLDLAGQAHTLGTVTVTAPADSGAAITAGDLTAASVIVRNLTGNVLISANLLGEGNLVKQSLGTLTLSGANTFTGGITINNGILTVADGGTLGTPGGALSINNSGQLNLAGGSHTFGAITVTSSGVGLLLTNGTVGASSIAVSSTVAGEVHLGADLEVSGNLTKSNGSTLVLSGTNSFAGAVTITSGVLKITGPLSGNTASSPLHFGGTATTVVEVSNDMSLFAIGGASATNAVAVYKQSAGDVTIQPGTATSNVSNQWIARAGYGYFELSGGTFTVTPGDNRFILTGGLSNGSSTSAMTGVMYVSGGTFNANAENFMLNYNSSNNSIGHLTVAGTGVLNHNDAKRPFSVFYDVNNSRGIVNLAGGSISTYGSQINSNGTTAGSILFGRDVPGSAANGQRGMFNIAGGTLTMRDFFLGNSPGDNNRAYVNFAGGQVVATADVPFVQTPGSAVQLVLTVFGGIDNSAVAGAPSFVGGAHFNTAGFTQEINLPLNAAGGFGVTQANIIIPTTGNSGYLSAPSVEFSEAGMIAGGTPAAGYALVENGAVVGIVITSPGTYEENATPTITLRGGGGSIGSFPVSALTPANQAGGLTKTGSGTLILSADNTYAGDTSVLAGTLNVTGSKSGTGAVTVASGATLTGTGTIAGTTTVLAGGTLLAALDGRNTLALSALTLGSGSLLNFDLADGSLSDLIDVTGLLTLNGGSITLNHSGELDGTYSLFQYGSLGGALGNLNIANRQSGKSYDFSLDDGFVKLTIAAMTGGPQDLTWSGGSGDWITGDYDEGDYADGDNVTFNDPAAPGASTVTIAAGGVQPGNIVVNNTVGNDYTFTGGPIGGPDATLTKTGTGKLVLASNFTGPGATNVQTGTLEVQGDFASQNIAVAGTLAFNPSVPQSIAGLISGSGTLEKTGSGTTTIANVNNTFDGATNVTQGVLAVNGTLGGTITVSGTGTLQGNGTAQDVVINSGGTLSVGGSVGQLTLDNNPAEPSPGDGSLTLNAGSTLVFEFNDAEGSPGAVNGGWDYIELGNGALTINADGSSPEQKITLQIVSLDTSNVPGQAENFDPSPADANQVVSYYWKFIGLTTLDLDAILPAGDAGLNDRFAIDYAGVFGPDDTPFAYPSSPFGSGTFRVVAGNFANVGGSNQGSGLYIHYSAVPEPGSLLLAGLGSLGAAWYGRRRQQKSAAATELAAADADAVRS